MPFLATIVPGSPTPIYKQIVDQVCAAIVSGDLEENEPLPSIRLLAEELVVNPTTVARAYADLARDGIIECHGTRGVFVSPRRQVYTRAERRRRIEPTLRAYLSEAFLLGFTPDEIRAQIDEEVEELSPSRTTKRKGAR
jgi:GntR family transcriptional regulator